MKTNPITFPAESQSPSGTSRFMSLACVACASLLVPMSAGAAVLTWNTTSGDWDSSTANWSGDATVYTDGDAVTFGATSGTATITESVAPGSIAATNASGTFTFRNNGGSIGGTGTLTKTGNGRLTISSSLSNTSNSFSGGTIINGGSLLWDDGNGTGFQALGTGLVTLNSGQFRLNRATVGNDLVVNGGTMFGGNGFGNTWSGAVTLNAGLAITFDGNINFSGNITGTGGLDITRTGGTTTRTITLNGVNSFTGNTTLNDGILRLVGTSLFDTNTLIVNGGLVQATGVETIGSLILGGVTQAPGSYGATGSGATFINDTYFTGTSGYVVIVPEPSSSILLGLTASLLLVRRRR